MIETDFIKHFKAGKAGERASATDESSGLVEVQPVELVWPSGEGHIVGRLEIGLEAAHGQILSYGNDPARGFVLTTLEEDDAKSLMLTELVAGPICLSWEPGIPKGKAVVVVDLETPVAAVREAIEPIFGKLVTFFD